MRRLIMDNISIREIQNKLVELPYLEKKLNALLIMIKDETKTVQEYMENYKLEAMDVENLQKQTLSVSVLKLIGKYDFVPW